MKLLLTCLLALAPALLVAFVMWGWPLLVSHAGEQQMIDGPGVLDHGVCCVEPAYHQWGRLARLVWPVAAIVSGVGLALALGGAAWGRVRLKR